MKRKEQRFMVAILERKYENEDMAYIRDSEGQLFAIQTNVRSIVNDIEIPRKQCLCYLMKWAHKNWYEYGVSLDLGWFTDAGLAKAKEVRERLSK